MPTVEEVVGKYVEIRDRKNALAKQQSEAMAPLNEALTGIENWLLDKMNQDGVDSYKTAAGTPYKAVSNSVQLQDPLAFKGFVLEPAAQQVFAFLHSQGYPLKQSDLPVIQNIIRDMAYWDMVDFRAGKKGILEHLENTSALPPGVAVSSTATVNVRRA